MFGVGPAELLVIGLLLLVLFGPEKLSRMARDLGRFANEARRPMDELKEELSMITEEETGRKKKEATHTQESETSQLKKG